jgi:oligoendopeptidase F
LSEAILNDGQEAVAKYLEFLSMGGSAYPLDELKHAGVDFTTTAPMERALMKFNKILDDVEETLKQI